MRILLSTLFICCVAGCLPEEPEEGDVADLPSADEVLASPEETAADTNETGLPPQGIAATGAWSTFPTICNGCGRNGNLVRLWQSVLWADGKFSDTRFIDGDFGQMTQGETRNWQGSFLPSDGRSGIVGPNTWGAAQSQRLRVDGEGLCKGGVIRFIYQGFAGRSFRLTNNCSTGVWLFVNPRTGATTDTSFN